MYPSSPQPLLGDTGKALYSLILEMGPENKLLSCQTKKASPDWPVGLVEKAMPKDSYKERTLDQRAGGAVLDAQMSSWLYQ